MMSSTIIAGNAEYNRLPSTLLLICYTRSSFTIVQKDMVRRRETKARDKTIATKLIN